MRSEYKCPVCNEVLREQVGTVLNPGDIKYGITLDCENKNCNVQEVAGHGDNAKKAYDIILMKYSKKG
jgi:hypothetical protein